MHFKILHPMWTNVCICSWLKLIISHWMVVWKWSKTEWIVMPRRKKGISPAVPRPCAAGSFRLNSDSRQSRNNLRRQLMRASKPCIAPIVSCLFSVGAHRKRGRKRDIPYTRSRARTWTRKKGRVTGQEEERKRGRMRERRGGRVRWSTI